MPVRRRVHTKKLQHVSKHQNDATHPEAEDPWIAFHEVNKNQLNVDPRYKSNGSQNKDNSEVGAGASAKRIYPKSKLRTIHRNACRTKVHFLLDRKQGLVPDQSNSPPKKRKRSLFLMSEEYKRKMSDCFTEITEQDVSAKRKISWSEQSEFVSFNKKKSCQAIKQAPRHKFSIDQ